MQSALPLLSCLLAVNAYSGGPPSSACKNMRPGPPHQPNTIRAGARSPHSLEATVCSTEGSPLVTLWSTKRGAFFRGFMIMAEVHGDKGHGYFIPFPESKDLTGRLDCEGLPKTCPNPDACQVAAHPPLPLTIPFNYQGTANAITHNSNDDKDTINVIWTAPSSMTGQVIFQATVVGENSDDKSTWWEDIRSNTVTLRP